MEESGIGATAARGAGDWRARAWPLALLLVMGLVWGLTFSLAKIATGAGGHPIGLALWQGLFGGLFLLALALLRRRPPRLLRSHLIFYLVCGLVGTTIPGVLFFYAAAEVPAGVLSISVAAVPIITLAAALPLGLERAAPGRVAGILLGVLAVVLIVAPETGLPNRAMVPWVLVAVLAASFYAAESLYVALRRPAGGDALGLTAGMMLMGALAISPLVLATGSFVPIGLPWGELEWSIVGMAVLGATAYAIYLYVIETAGPVFATQTAYVVTLSGVLWGMAIFGERHSLWIWAALAVMLAGLALVTPRPARGSA